MIDEKMKKFNEENLELDLRQREEIVLEDSEKNVIRLADALATLGVEELVTQVSRGNDGIMLYRIIIPTIIDTETNEPIASSGDRGYSYFWHGAYRGLINKLNARRGHLALNAHGFIIPIRLNPYSKFLVE
jgi:hypothetical protein